MRSSDPVDTARLSLMLTDLRLPGISNHQKRIGCANDPVRLSPKLSLKRNSIPNTVGDEMVKAVILARCKPLRHRLDTLTVTGTNEPNHIQRAHRTSFLVSQLLQKWL